MILDKNDVPLVPASGGGIPGICDSRRLQSFAGRAMAERELRYAHFDRALFGEPVWDILLALYLAALPEQKTLAAINEHCGLAIGTCARWLRILVEHGLVSLEDDESRGLAPNPHANLTRVGRRKLDAYLAACNRLAVS